MHGPDWTDDHTARITLLVHILTNTPHRQITGSDCRRAARVIWANDFKGSLNVIKHRVENRELLEKYHILEQVIDARTRLEQYDAGMIGT